MEEQIYQAMLNSYKVIIEGVEPSIIIESNKGYFIHHPSDEIERERLEIALRETERKKRYIDNRDKNLAEFSATGVEISSESYKRFFASAKETYLKDRDAISLRGIDEVERSADLLELAKIDEKSNLKIGKTKALKQVTDGIIASAKILEETPTG